MTHELTMEEYSETITGFEEIAIAKHFGEDWSTLPESKPTMFMRALIFTDLVREGDDPKTAKRRALEMTLKAANEYYAEPEDEPVPDDPITESGKDDEQPLAEPPS